jgi:hypothetical protein
MNSFGDWLNNNQGILAVIISSTDFSHMFIPGLRKKLFSKKTNKSKPTPEKPTTIGLAREH